MGTRPFPVPKWNVIPGNPRLSTLRQQRGQASRVPLSKAENAAAQRTIASRIAPRRSSVRVRLAPSEVARRCGTPGCTCQLLAPVACHGGPARQQWRCSVTGRRSHVRHRRPARRRRRRPVAVALRRRTDRRDSPPRHSSSQTTASGATSSRSRGTSRPWRVRRASRTCSIARSGTEAPRLSRHRAAGRGRGRDRGLDRVRDRGRPRPRTPPAAGRQGVDPAHHARRAQGPRAGRSGPAAEGGGARGRPRAGDVAREPRARGGGARVRLPSPTS